METEATGTDNYKGILTELGLLQDYQHGITFPRAIKIGTCPDVLKTSDLPWNLIRMLMKLDYRARDDFLSKIKSETVGEDSESDSSESESDSDVENQIKSNLPPNPVDVLLATFVCCDGILQQCLSENLFLCKLAIPVLYPVSSQNDLVLSLWALRTIIVQSSEAENPPIETSVTDGSFHVVSFVRLGKPQRSKSKLLNGILTGGTHETFYSSDCHKKTRKRQIANGILECAWFLPGAETDSLKLPGVTLFLNLRGNGLAHQKQIRFVNKISSLIVVMATDEDLAKPDYVDSFVRICKESKKVLLLQTNKSKKKTTGRDKERERTDAVGEAAERFERIIVKKKMKDDILLDRLVKIMPTLLDQSSKVSLEAAAQQYATDGIQVDENSPACLEGKRLAKGLVEQMAGEYTECKRNLLPLQEKTWQEYSDLSKQQSREGNKEETKEQLAKLRREQADICENPTKFLCNFLRAVVGTESDDVRLYFLQWMKLLLDTESRRHLPRLRKNFNEVWEKHNKAKLSPHQDQNYQEILKQAERDIASASFGLEHVFRELGHLYEVVHEKHANVNQEFKNALDLLPAVVAKLLLAGSSLELVNGDAAIIPVTWLEAVLLKLKSIIGEERLFIISVLGIQSSGKSTLLNTLFGLKFAVSAGRCTRGAFMQVIEVDRPDLPVKYLAVIDTEGLRAPELAQLKHTHDNELATLVIGLADITLINNKGENTAEMKDVLQIAVHAFMRMKIVNRNLSIERSCLFIHQNVPAPDAKKKMRQGVQKLQEQLDLMTQSAAEAEGLQDIKSFSQIIRFDIEKHVLYFSDLWQGNPPMAPVNLGYSNNATNVKECLLEAIENQKSFSTVSKFTSHIRDLWKGVVAENFVLSYRNGLEVKAYHAMEKQIKRLQWELDNSVASWFETTADIGIKKCETLEELDTLFASLQTDLSKVIANETAKMKQSLTDFFETNQLKEILIQWKQQTLIKLETHSADCRRTTFDQISSTKKDQSKSLQGKKKIDKLEAELIESAGKLASKLKGKDMSECELQKEFDTMWKDAKISELAEQEHAGGLRVDTIIWTVLMELFNHSQLLMDELERQDLSKPLEHSSLAESFTLADVDKKDISMSTNFLDKLTRVLTKGAPVEEAQRCTINETSRILVGLDTKLRDLCRRGIKFQKAHAETIINTLKAQLDEFNQNVAKTFSILPTYTVKLTVHVGRHCVKIFTKMQNDYEKKHGLAAKLKSARDKAWEIFVSTVKQCAEEVIAADLFCYQLKGVVESQIESDLPRQIVNEVMQSINVTKHDLIVEILRSLAKDDDFDNFLSYIGNPNSFALRWIEKYTHNKVFFVECGRSMSKCGELVEENIKRIMGCVEQSIANAQEKVNQDSENKIGVWISTFCELKQLPVNITCFEALKQRKVEDFSRFTQFILQQLESTKKILLEHIRTPEANIKWKDMAPSQEIYDRIWGCGAQCPFCKEPCMFTIADHTLDHKCLQHRPEGLGTYRWTRILFWGGQLVTETCNNSVASSSMFRNSEASFHPYKQYKDIYKDWDIEGDSSNTASPYWAWFMTTYKQKLAEKYDAREPNIPAEWTMITKADAIESLDD